MPASILLEKPARNLDSLVTSDALDRLRSTLLHEWQHRYLFDDLQEYGIRPTTAALFHGPPGNGKTVAAKMLAQELDCPLYRVACESVLDSYLGGSESNMRKILDWLATQGPAVVLFDECENLFRRRGGSSGSSQAVERTMQVFWQLLDRWETPQLFLMATNLLDEIDSALQSRIELHLEFGPPTKEQARSVVEYWVETLHEYGSDIWGPVLLKQLRGGWTPQSFRSLWQDISDSVRAFVLSAGSDE